MGLTDVARLIMNSRGFRQDLGVISIAAWLAGNGKSSSCISTQRNTCSPRCLIHFLSHRPFHPSKAQPEGWTTRQTTLKRCHHKRPTWSSFACLITLLEPHECKQQTKKIKWFGIVSRKHGRVSTIKVYMKKKAAKHRSRATEGTQWK